MGILDGIFSGSAPTTNNSSLYTQQYPQWYTDTMRGTAAQAVNAASAPRPVYPGLEVAGLTQDQRAAQNLTRSNVGNWQAPLDAAMTSANGAQAATAPYLDAASAAGSAASSAVSGSPSQWPDQMKKYMSPYTSQVIDEIGRLGTRNLSERLLPALNNSFIGAGGYGSTRNAEALARETREAGSDILGQQARSLESGYGTAANIFGGDANRTQQQQQLQSNAALAGGRMSLEAAQLAANQAQNRTGNLQGLARNYQNLGSNDVGNLSGIGRIEQGIDQSRFNSKFADFKDARDYDWNQVNKLTNTLGNLRPPVTTTTASNASGTPSTPSGLQWLEYINSLGKTVKPNPNPNIQPSPTGP